MTTMMTIRLDADDKLAFERFCKSVGMTPSTTVNLFVKTTLRLGELPFPVETDPFYSGVNTARLRKNAAEMEAAYGTSHER